MQLQIPNDSNALDVLPFTLSMFSRPIFFYEAEAMRRHRCGGPSPLAPFEQPLKVPDAELGN